MLKILRLTAVVLSSILLVAPFAQAQSATATAQGTIASDGTYGVVAGDTLYGIATRYGLTVAQLASANALGANPTVYVGQKLIIPGQTSTAVTSERATAAPVAGAATHTVQPGETYYSISRKYSVSVGPLMAANAASDPGQLAVGQVLKIPGTATTNTATTGAAATPTAPIAPAGDAPITTAAAPRTHTVQAGQTFYSIARLYSVEVSALMSANGVTNPSQLAVGQVLQIPGQGAVAAGVPIDEQATPTPEGFGEVFEGVVLNVPKPPARTDAAQNQEPLPTQTAASPQAAEGTEVTVSNEPATPLALPNPPPRRGSKFYWPARGKIVTRYGSQGNGQTSDGIEIAVAPGSNVVAAEDGVVAFAGTGVSGYGFLVLIKHADNFYTAYAQNSAVTVKRGQVVRRGALIARAGTKSVGTNGRLHFEVRHKEAPVNPIRYMVN